MATRRRMRFVHWQVGWMLATILALALLGSLSFGLFLALSVLGLLVVAEVTAPVNVTPQWRSRVRRLLLVGLAAFAIVALVRLRAILPLGVVA